MTETISEFFERANKIENEYDRAKAVWSNDNARVREFLSIALHPNIEWQLPEGEPPYTPANDVNTHGNAWGEIRKLKMFIKGHYENLTDARRQALFIQTLEYVHPKDAQLLLAIKDKQWPFENIDATMVNKIWPNTINI